MQILIPMAGEGSRFSSAGYINPKPLIDVNGLPMIARVIENLKFDANYIFLVREKHLIEFPELEPILKKITNGNYKIVKVNKLTEGAACTALLAKDVVDLDDDLLIANSDQIIDYSKDNFITLKQHSLLDSIVFVFNDSNPKWSFVKLNNGLVCEVAEKNPISNIATCGIYWYRKSRYFFDGAKEMIAKDIRVNNEFYIAPVYNELISQGKTLAPFYVNKMHGIGIPEDLERYLKVC